MLAVHCTQRRLLSPELISPHVSDLFTYQHVQRVLQALLDHTVLG